MPRAEPRARKPEAQALSSYEPVSPMLNSELFWRARGHILYAHVYGDKSAFSRRAVRGAESETVNSHKFNYENATEMEDPASLFAG